MLYAGIDYSMTSPSVCVTDGDFFHFKILNKVKKYHGDYTHENFKISIVPFPEFSNNMERYVGISKVVNDFLDTYKEPISADLEGYSYGSKGSLIFNIAEHTQTLKIRLYNNPNVNLLLNTPAPTTIKKFATNSGKASKEEMYDAFLEQTKFDVASFLSCGKEKNPVNDLVDSYFITQFIKNNY